MECNTLVFPECMEPYMENQIKRIVAKNSFTSNRRVGVSRSKPENILTTCMKFYEIGECCEKLLNRAEKDILVLGLDLDWPNAYKSVFKAKQIHICSGENECAVFNVSGFDSIPKALPVLLKHPNVRLAGYSIHKDITKLGQNFSFQVDDIIAKLEHPRKLVEYKLSCLHQWSLQSVVEKGFEHIEDIPTEPQVNKFKFQGKVNFTNTFYDCGAICEKLLKIINNFSEDKKLVFGFDTEWPFTFKAGPGNGRVALIQMCPDERICFLFHVANFISLPKALVLLLKHPQVKLSGLNIANDIRKIGRDFRIEVTDIIRHRIIELSSLANQQLKTSHRWSLDGLVLNQLKMVLEKPKNVRCSNWAEDQLKREQITYAAADAYASLAVYNHLMGVKSPDLLSLMN